MIKEIIFDLYSNWQNILIGLFIFSCIIQLFYYLFFFSRILFYKGSNKCNPVIPVSILICAKNEGISLKKNLPKILAQNYPEFEVIVVNDCSVDDTEEILMALKREYHNLKYTTIEQDKKFIHGKKLALTVGIKAAKNELLLLTDADCFPKSKNWLYQMQQNFDDKTDIVLGYGGYLSKKGLLNKMIRFDTVFIAIQYLSYALAGFPYMGVGRNLAYRKKLFFKNKGFAGHAHILSGDDDLFINKISTKTNTKIEIHPESYTLSEPKEKFTEWVEQKKRHLTTGIYYKRKYKLLIGSEIISRFFFYLSFLILMILKINFEQILFVFILRMIIQGVIIKKLMNKFYEKGFFLFTYIFDIILPIINLYLLFSNYFFSKRNKWT
ncbi:MAG: glycosyltransferase [Bacteroidales bacterium]|nr:glycosyltransferase [Bacteroidales bacterium]